jgi:glycosyltransferase involved in cell wall biosynthesis
MIAASPGSGEFKHPDGIHVSEVRRRTTLQDRYRRWRTPDPVTRSPQGSFTGAKRADTERAGRNRARELVRIIRSSVGDPLAFPDDGRGWLLRAARTTRKIVHEWAPDVVISTGPPHSVHLAAAMGLVRADIPWIVDLRDPWVTPSHHHSPRGWSLALARRLEGWVFRRADLMLTTTPELRDALQRHFPAIRLIWLPNGVDTRELPPRVAHESPGLTLTHLGSVYFNRDPTPVIRAFARFLTANPEAASAGSTMRFVGEVSGGFRRRLEQTMNDLGIRRHVEITGTVPRAEALEVLSRSRIALVLAQGQHTMIPAKLYEAVGMGLPTLVITEADSATGREGQRLGAAVHGPEDEEGIAATMGEIWSRGGNSQRAIPSRVDHAHLAAELSGILNSLTSDPVATG